MRGPADDAPFGDEEVRALLDCCRDLNGNVMIGVSGGSDSLAMLLLFKRWRELWRGYGHSVPNLLAATVDHGLRPESRVEADHVAALAAAWDIEHVRLDWTGPKPATGLPAAAREARYRVLTELAVERGIQNIAVAHTLEDQAETVLMRLLKGSGVQGLGGMDRGSFRGPIVLMRPLLTVSRTRLRASLKFANVSWVDDPTNEDERYLRPRLRALMPALAAEGLTVARLGDLAAKMQRADWAIERDLWRFFFNHVKAEPRPAVELAQSELDHPYPVQFHAPSSHLEPAPRFPSERMLLAIDVGLFRAEPFEIRLRALDRCIKAVTHRKEPSDEDAVERIVEAIGEQWQDDLKPVRRTLHGALISAGTKRIRIAPEPPRKARP